LEVPRFPFFLIILDSRENSACFLDFSFEDFWGLLGLLLFIFIVGFQFDENKKLYDLFIVVKF